MTSLHDVQAPTPTKADPEADLSEAYEQLTAMGQRKLGRIPPELMAGHVIEIHREAPWAVKRAALEALLRRFAFARRDALRVAERPAGAIPFGPYRTRAHGDAPRPYRTLLHSLTPLDGSCDCPDFLRASLGVCKHLLVVIDALASQPRKLERGLGATATTNPRCARCSGRSGNSWSRSSTRVGGAGHRCGAYAARCMPIREKAWPAS